MKYTLWFTNIVLSLLVQLLFFASNSKAGIINLIDQTYGAGAGSFELFNPALPGNIVPTPLASLRAPAD